MITLALQIFFGVGAFRNGWRWRAAIPCLVAFGTAGLLRVVSSLQGQEIDIFLPIFLVLDIGLICVLAHMSRNAAVEHFHITPASELPTQTAART